MLTKNVTPFSFTVVVGLFLILAASISGSVINSQPAAVSKAITYSVWYSGNGNTGGSVPVDSNNYTSGASATVLGNMGNLTKTGFAFSGWNSFSNGTGTDYPGGSNVYVTGNTAMYAKWVRAYSVTYSSNGNTGGSVPVDSNNYTSGASATVLGNTGNLTKTGYVFNGWNWGTFPVGDTITITGNVTLSAKWSTSITYSVIYNGNGNTGGSVPSDSRSYTSGSSVTVLGNTIGLTKTGYTFNGWNFVADGTGTNYSAGSTFLITSNKTLYAIWAPVLVSNANGGDSLASDAASSLPYVLPISCTGTYSIVSNNITWRAYGGESGSLDNPSTISWSGTDGLSGNSRTVSKIYTIDGTKTATVKATDRTYSKSATCFMVVRVPDITADCSGMPSSVIVGSPVTWTANARGGVGDGSPYIYSWSGGSGSDAISGNTQTVTKTYTLTIPSTKNATVVVSSGPRSATVNCSVAVTPVPEVSVSCKASPTSVIVGGTITWTATPAGGLGSGTYGYTWSGSDGLTGIGTSDYPTISKAYTSTTPPSKTAIISVRSGGKSATNSCLATIISPPPLAVSCSASPTSEIVGGTINWSAVPTGGNGTYTYSWTGTDSLSGTTQSISKSYSSTTPPSKTAIITVKSGSQTVSNSCSATITNPPPLAVTCSSYPSSIISGGATTWTANPTGGLGFNSYTYSWTGTDSLSGTTQSISKSYSSTTPPSKTAIITVKSGSQTVSNSCSLTVTTPPPLSVSCNATPSSIVVGNMASWRASATGGAGEDSYFYSWTGTHGLGGSSRSVSNTYSTVGTETATVTVRSGSLTAVSPQCSLNVTASAPLFASCSPLPTSSRLRSGSINWIALISSGAGSSPSKFVWSGSDGFSATQIGTATDANTYYTYTATGTKTASVTITTYGTGGGQTKTFTCVPALINP